MEQTKVKRQPIYFNEHGYNHEFKQYSHKKALEGLILNEFSKIGVKKVNYNNNILGTFYLKVEEVHKENNSLKLSGKKLCSLLEIDDSLIKSHSVQYEKFRDFIKPKKDAFTLFAETDKELYRLDYAKRLIEVLNELKEHRQVHWNVMIQAFNGVIKLNGISEYIVNPNFVKY
jgi:hypothetical protein